MDPVKRIELFNPLEPPFATKTAHSPPGDWAAPPTSSHTYHTVTLHELHRKHTATCKSDSRSLPLVAVSRFGGPRLRDFTSARCFYPSFPSVTVILLHETVLLDSLLLLLPPPFLRPLSNAIPG